MSVHIGGVGIVAQALFASWSWIEVVEAVWMKRQRVHENIT